MNIFRSKWLNIYKGRTGLGFMYEAGDYDESRHTLIFNLIFISIYISLPWKNKDWSCDPKMYGIETYKTVYEHWYDIFDQIYVRFGNKCWFIEMPWYEEWTYTAVQLKNGNWIVEDYRTKSLHRSYKRYFDKLLIINTEHDWSYYANDDFKSQIYYDYVYTYEPTGQKVNCRYYICERCWRPKWFKWTDIFSYKKRCIEVEFEEGMGPNRDTWKGGVYGCRFNMKPGESPEDCIKRMEKEYEF